MGESKTGSWLDKIRGEVKKARRSMELERDKLKAERVALEAKIRSLEQEMTVLDKLDMHSGGQPGWPQPELKPVRLERSPLSQRVLEALGDPEAALTSLELRESLHLDKRESRNLGPVLNQLAKKGKLANAGRGAPWRRIP